MNFFYLFIFCLTSSIISAQDFYDLETIQTIEITFAQNNWDQLLDAEKASTEDYILAESITINGETLDSIGVKYKGNSTYNSNQTKNPLHIELDTYKDHSYDGYNDIKLSNVAKDPSFLREVLSYQILRQYMDAPLSNYANVYINGDLIGLYSNSEAVSKTFLKDRFDSKKNTFIKCNPPDGAGPQSNDLPNLVYLGTDSTQYYDAYELKSETGWLGLIHLCDTLANQVDAIEEILDVDRVLWMLAFDNMLVNLDSYIGGFAQNYYLYRDKNDRFLPVVWDLNESFGRFARTGSGNLNSTTAKQQMSPLLQLNDTDYPLIQKLLNIPTYQRMYLAHCKTMLLENFANNAYFDQGTALQAVIDQAVQADGNKFFTYNNFLNNLTSDVGGGPGPGGGSTPGITNLMDGRTDYLLGLSAFNQVTPTIDNITPSDDAPVIGDEITIAASISEATNVYLGHRIKKTAVFQKITMLDDGAHGDGAANDGVYGTSFTIADALTQYYIYAENDQAGIFSPQRAEYEYHELTATLSDPVVGDLVINEFMATNQTTVADDAGEFEDWIELYNNGSTEIDLAGYFLSDDGEDLLKWSFPLGTVIAPNGYLTIWADKDDTQEGLHADFKLSSAGESLFLVDPLGNILDEVSFGTQTTDIAYGRFPNGTGNFQKLFPTFGAENTTVVGTELLEKEVYALALYPNPAHDLVYLELTARELQVRPVTIYHMNGQLQYRGEMTESLELNVQHWTPGIYVVRVEAVYLKMIVL